MSINNLISKAQEGLNLNRTLAKKVWVYTENGETLFFESKEGAARYLNVPFINITNHLDKWIKGGINGNYLFSKELNEPLGGRGKRKLLGIFNLRKTNNCEVWVYDANTLELLYDKFNSMKKAAEQFNIDYRTILKHLDTNKVILKDNKLVLLYSCAPSGRTKKLTLDNIKNLVAARKEKNIKNEIIKIWVYKEVNNELLLLNNNESTFNTINKVSKELKICTKTIAKYIDTKKLYKNFYFYSKKL